MLHPERRDSVGTGVHSRLPPPRPQAVLLSGFGILCFNSFLRLEDVRAGETGKNVEYNPVTTLVGEMGELLVSTYSLFQPGLCVSGAECMKP